MTLIHAEPRPLLIQLESNQALGKAHVHRQNSQFTRFCVQVGLEQQGCDYLELKQLSPAQCFEVGPFL